MKRILSFVRDERGDMVQNIAWLVAVSIGAVVVGGLVYGGIRSFGQRTSNTINGIEPPAVPDVDYN